jgi:hypothetical protein
MTPLQMQSNIPTTSFKQPLVSQAKIIGKDAGADMNSRLERKNEDLFARFAFIKK